MYARPTAAHELALSTCTSSRWNYPTWCAERAVLPGGAWGLGAAAAAFDACDDASHACTRYARQDVTLRPRFHLCLDPASLDVV